MPASLRQIVSAPESFGRPADSFRRPWLWWHLLSLDAPTVAVVWCWFLGAAFRVHFSWVTLPILGLGTWIVYVGDRLLDGWSATSASALRDRHWFYVRHRRLFAVASVLVSIPLAYLILFRAQAGVRAGDIALCILGIGYFFVVHGRSYFRSDARPTRTTIPKELVVGFVFAAACALPAWMRLQHHNGMLLLAVLALGAVCWLNCVAIQTWEDAEAAREIVHSILADRQDAAAAGLTAWLGNHLRAFAVLLGMVSLSAAAISPASPASLPLLAVALSCVLFVVLERSRARFTALSLRIAADAALLTPLLFWIRVR